MIWRTPPRFVETLPRKGYRFMPAVVRVGAVGGESYDSARTDPPAQHLAVFSFGVMLYELAVGHGGGWLTAHDRADHFALYHREKAWPGRHGSGLPGAGYALESDSSLEDGAP